jgi:hypothetical protein
LIALLKFTLTPALVPIDVAEFGGATEMMVGAAASDAEPVPNVYVKGVTGTLLVFVTEFVTVTVYCVMAVRLPVGLMVIT